MRNTLLSAFMATALALAAALPVSTTPAAAQSGCWNNSDIQAALADGSIQPVAQVLEREGIPGSTEVLNVKVCEEGGTPVYVLAVLEASGEARNLTLNAQ